MSQLDTADISMFFIRLVIDECCCECRLKYDSLFRIIIGVISYIVLYTVFIVYRLDQIWEDGNKEFTLFFFIYSFLLFALPIAVAFYRSVRGNGSEQSLRFHMLIYRITEMHIDVAMFFYGLYLEDFQMTTLSMITTSLSVVNTILSGHGFIQLLRIVIEYQDHETQVLLIMAMCSSWVVMPLFILFVGPVFLKRACSWRCLKGCCSSIISPETQTRFVHPAKENTLPSRPRSPCDNTLMPGYLVQNWIQQVHLNGGLINPRIVMAAAQAIVEKFELKSNGGSVSITKSYVESLLRHMGFAKRNGNKAINPPSEDFDAIKTTYIEEIRTLVKKHSVPDSLIINWGQIVCKLVPGGRWTKEKKRTLQISTTGHQSTLLLAVTKDGELLQSDLIYSGKTDSSLSNVKFPESLSCTSAESYSSKDITIRFINRVVIPYVEKIRTLPPASNDKQKAIAIFDECHRGKKLLKSLEDHDIFPVFVPTAFTDKLQPLDLTIKREYKKYKAELKLNFQDWYSTEVKKQLKQQENNIVSEENMVVNLKFSVLKAIHANWVVDTHGKIATDDDLKQLIQNGFHSAGL